MARYQAERGLVDGHRTQAHQLREEMAAILSAEGHRRPAAKSKFLRVLLGGLQLLHRSVRERVRYREVSWVDRDETRLLQPEYALVVCAPLPDLESSDFDRYGSTFGGGALWSGESSDASAMPWRLREQL
eukprot:CAMPEP_0119487246 /NCGR_PEP_ID=MMETSP1344-20130328/13390_1 /TAXON_ID=236787 /ORGANISM="Florenciella parvula, Strain CCMP2471" /LENGTH=129 /DNA_ID=CAMNT_0007522087 /DNA_START=285 /DNA_END=672 /DNA_ORIENTATION=+